MTDEAGVGECVCECSACWAPRLRGGACLCTLCTDDHHDHQSQAEARTRPRACQHTVATPPDPDRV